MQPPDLLIQRRRRQPKPRDDDGFLAPDPSGAIVAIPSVLIVTLRLVRNAVISTAFLNTGRIGCVAEAVKNAPNPRR
jgi:hypothetical protein